MTRNVFDTICALAVVIAAAMVLIAAVQSLLTPEEQDCPCEMVRDHECPPPTPSCDAGFCPTKRPQQAVRWFGVEI